MYISTQLQILETNLLSSEPFTLEFIILLLVPNWSSKRSEFKKHEAGHTDTADWTPRRHGHVQNVSQLFGLRRMSMLRIWRIVASGEGNASPFLVARVSEIFFIYLIFIYLVIYLVFLVIFCP